MVYEGEVLATWEIPTTHKTWLIGFGDLLFVAGSLYRAVGCDAKMEKIFLDKFSD
jgi:hypothetical protein